MPSDGTPELATKRFGVEVARLRNARKWPRARVIHHLLDELDPDDPGFDRINETWLARLEKGRVVKVPRTMVEALGRALRCSDRERIQLLLAADRNPLAADDDEGARVAETLMYVSDWMYREACEVMAGMMGQRRAADLSDDELVRLATKAFELIARQRQRR